MAFFDSTKMISDPDLLIYYAGASASTPASANLVVDYNTLKISLKLGATGAGSGCVIDGGATLKCVYSKLKEVWKSDATLIKFPFPMLPITDEQFELINGWDFADTTTRQLIRTGGWALKTADGLTTVEEYAGVISLGSLASTSHQIYYTQSPMTTIAATGSTTNFALTGPVNQAILISSASGANNYKAYLKLFCREYGSSYANSTLTDIGVPALTYQCYRFPVTTSTDLKAIDSNPTTGVYAGMSIQWYATPQAKVATTTANYNVIIQGNNGTAQQVYEYVQFKLSKSVTADIDANATAGYVKYGRVAPDLLRFVGDTLYTTYQSVGPTGGVWIEAINAVDQNSVYFADNLNINNYYPYQAVLRINFGDNVINDVTSKFTVFFTNANGNQYGTTTAVIVKDAVSADMNYVIRSSPSSASWITNKYADLSFDYDANVQGGRTAGADAAITVVALGLGTAQYVKATGTIAKSKANSVSLVASLERNYLNP
jgi:hypothetical protein